jgi:general secretion pathway protein M
LTADMSPVVRRIVAGALLLIVLFLCWSAVVGPLLDSYREAQATIQSLGPAVERAASDADDLADLKGKVDQLRSQQNDAAGLLAGANESIAAAQLQTRLKAIADSAKGELKSTQILVAHDEGNFRRITVRGEISGNLAAVQRIIYLLEANSPYLFLDDVDIRLNPVRGGPDGTASGLDLRLDVSGYLRRPA